MEEKEAAAPSDRRMFWILGAACIALLAFNLYSTFSWSIDDVQQRSFFLGATIVLSALLYPFAPPRPSHAVRMAVDGALILGGVYVAAYIYLGFEDVFNRAGAINHHDLIVAVIATVLVLEVTRRSSGWTLPVMSVAFLSYPLVIGPYMPGFLRIGAYDLDRVMTTTYLSLSGILGIPLKVMIQTIFLYVLFGAVMERLGIVGFFIDLARALSGAATGGSAKIAVVSSGLLGSVSGSATANVMTTGVVTIPMMKRAGFTPTFAGAVEAAASTGGQLLPPVMGAAAFLMAEYTRTPYSTIVQYALVPALLYYFTIYLAVHFEARRLNLRGEPRSQLPRVWDLFRSQGLCLVPLVLLTYMIMADYSPIDAVIWAMVSAPVTAFLVPSLRRNVTIENLVEAIRSGTAASIPMLAGSACAGIVVGVVTLTGLGLKISSLIIDFSFGSSAIALVLAAIVCLIFGMGLPTTIIYLTLAVLVAPGIANLGIPTMAVHMFIFYYGMMSMVTPPVCFAAFAAASLSGAGMMQTGYVAVRLAVAGLIVPFYFAYNPGLFLLGSPLQVFLDILQAVVGCTAAAVAAGAVRPPAAAQYSSVAFAAGRVLLAASAIALVSPRPAIYVPALCIGLVGLYLSGIIKLPALARAGR